MSLFENPDCTFEETVDKLGQNECRQCGLTLDASPGATCVACKIPKKGAQYNLRLTSWDKNPAYMRRVQADAAEDSDDDDDDDDDYCSTGDDTDKCGSVQERPQKRRCIGPGVTHTDPDVATGTGTGAGAGTGAGRDMETLSIHILDMNAGLATNSVRKYAKTATAIASRVGCSDPRLFDAQFAIILDVATRAVAMTRTQEQLNRLGIEWSEEAADAHKLRVQKNVKDCVCASRAMQKAVKVHGDWLCKQLFGVEATAD